MAAKKTSVLVAPYSKSGSLLHYTSQSTGVDTPHNEEGWGFGVRWHPNEPFTETLTLGGVTSGMSAKYVTWRAEDGRTFPMFVSDLVDFIHRIQAEVNKGTVTARWMVAKRGAN